MARILRGEIWWVDRNPVLGQKPGGKRPVLVISEDIFNQRSGTVIALAITSQPQRASFPLTEALPLGTLPKPSWVKIRALPDLPWSTSTSSVLGFLSRVIVS